MLLEGRAGLMGFEQAAPFLDIRRIAKALQVIFDPVPFHRENVAALGLQAAAHLMAEIAAGAGQGERKPLSEIQATRAPALISSTRLEGNTTVTVVPLPATKVVAL